jgi:ribonuclease BN (tRNA processing enzyme)
MMARLTVLGSGTGIPTGRRASPGLLLEKERASAMLIDPGPGALCRMAACGTPVEDVDRVLLTHHHPDHTLDLMALLFARHNAWLKPRLKILTLLGPHGTSDLLDRMIGLYGDWIRAGKEELEVVELGPGPLPASSGLEGTAFSTRHTEGSLGYRLHWGGAVLAVSGDTGPCDPLVPLGLEADLFLLECAVPDEYHPVPGHMTPSDVGRVADLARPRKLALYHLYPPVDPQEALQRVRRFYSGDAMVAEDGDVFSFPETVEDSEHHA